MPITYQKQKNGTYNVWSINHKGNRLALKKGLMLDMVSKVGLKHFPDVWCTLSLKDGSKADEPWKGKLVVEESSDGSEVNYKVCSFDLDKIYFNKSIIVTQNSNHYFGNKQLAELHCHNKERMFDYNSVLNFEISTNTVKLHRTKLKISDYFSEQRFNESSDKSVIYHCLEQFSYKYKQNYLEDNE